nr:hypothetical protein [Bordetella parapertussis]
MRQPARQAAMGGHGGQGLAAKGNGAGRDGLHAGQAAQQGGLARAIGADDGDDLAAVDLQVDAVQHFDAPVARA